MYPIRTEKEENDKKRAAGFQSGWVHDKYDWKFVRSKQKFTYLLINEHHCTHYSSKTISDK